jgi:hypothetical protein
MHEGECFFFSALFSLLSKEKATRRGSRAILSPCADAPRGAFSALAASSPAAASGRRAGARAGPPVCAAAASSKTGAAPSAPAVMAAIVKRAGFPRDATGDERVRLLGRRRWAELRVAGIAEVAAAPSDDSSRLRSGRARRAAHAPTAARRRRMAALSDLKRCIQPRWHTGGLEYAGISSQRCATRRQLTPFPPSPFLPLSPLPVSPSAMLAARSPSGRLQSSLAPCEGWLKKKSKRGFWQSR